MLNLIQHDDLGLSPDDRSRQGIGDGIMLCVWAAGALLLEDRMSKE